MISYALLRFIMATPLYIIIMLLIPAISYCQDDVNSLLLPHNTGGLCNQTSCLKWTPWMSADLPTRGGDFETISYPDDMGKPGTVQASNLKATQICASPISIQCRTRDDKIPWTETSDNFDVPCTIERGLICLNKNQFQHRMCRNYEIRFLCWEECAYLLWSRWLNFDKPTGRGDVEILGRTIPHDQWPCKGGEFPVDVQCETVSGVPYYQTKKVGLRCNTYGFSCLNENQDPECRCDDYQVRFLCPKKEYFSNDYHIAPF